MRTQNSFAGSSVAAPVAAWVGVFLFGAALSNAVAGPCAVPDARHKTIQSAVNDHTCSEIILGANVYNEQLTLNRTDGIILRGVGAERTVIASPSLRSRSSVSTTYQSGYTYVVQVTPGTSATLSDLTIDGVSSAKCGERLFGIRFSAAKGELDRVVVENIRARGSDFGCANVFGVGVTAESGTKAGSATLTISGSTIRAFQQIGLVANGGAARLAVTDTILHGAGAQSLIAQTGVALQAGAGGSLDRLTVTDLTYGGTPCTTAGTTVGTAVAVASASATTITRGVFHTVDRGVLLSKNSSGVVSVSNNRFVETLGGILSTDNGPTPMGGSPIIQIGQNGFISTARSSLATATCFADSGDGIAVKNDAGSQIAGNSAADSARDAIELLAGTSNLAVKDNQLVRSARADLEDAGSGNVLGNNLCQTSTPAGLCTGAP